MAVVKGCCSTHDSRAVNSDTLAGGNKGEPQSSGSGDKKGFTALRKWQEREKVIIVNVTSSAARALSATQFQLYHSNWGGWGSRPGLCSETLSQKQIVMGAGPGRLVGNGASRTCRSGRREWTPRSYSPTCTCALWYMLASSSHAPVNK